MSNINRQVLEEIAIRFHKEIEGEYGCPGASCPGVACLILAFAALKGVGQRMSRVFACGCRDNGSFCIRPDHGK